MSEYLVGAPFNLNSTRRLPRDVRLAIICWRSAHNYTRVLKKLKARIAKLYPTQEQIAEMAKTKSLYALQTGITPETKRGSFIVPRCDNEGQPVLFRWRLVNYSYSANSMCEYEYALHGSATEEEIQEAEWVADDAEIIRLSRHLWYNLYYRSCRLNTASEKASGFYAGNGTKEFFFLRPPDIVIVNTFGTIKRVPLVEEFYL